jgi:hypothetical protein
VIASTLDDREALDRARAAGTLPTLRADDKNGQEALRLCMSKGENRAECLAVIDAGLDDRGLYCSGGVLRISQTARTCIPFVKESARKVAIQAAEAKAAGSSSATPVVALLAVGLVAWLVLR